MTRKAGLGACASAVAAIALLLTPSGAEAFSFLPGGFVPGEQITSIELVSGGGTPLTFDTGADPNDPADNTVVMNTEVSRITTTVGVYNIPVGTMYVQTSSLDFVAGTIPIPPGGAGITSGYSNISLVDLTILDLLASPGEEVLFEADFTAHLIFNAGVFAGTSISGGIDGDLDIVGGELDFINAFGTSGGISGVLTSFNPDGDICALTNSPTCFLFNASDLADFTVGGATLTIIPNAIVPEPHTLVLMAGGLVALAARKRR